MTKISYEVVDINGKAAGSIDLDATVFGVEVKPLAVHQTVRWQRAKARSGTHATLTKGMMKGGNRKPWNQKHSGRARAGSNTSPLWVGGGISHGPQPRDYSFRLSKRTRTEALTSVLSDRVAKKTIKIVKGFSFASKKTKDAAVALTALGCDIGRQVVVVLPKAPEARAALARVVGNIPGVTTLPVEGINVYDLMKAKAIIAPQETIAEITERLAAE
jgi:large subunit ribosomal protein L4